MVKPMKFKNLQPGDKFRSPEWTGPYGIKIAGPAPHYVESIGWTLVSANPEMEVELITTNETRQAA